jgi:formylglycine-generating enzyme required for sulfatase activity
VYALGVVFYELVTGRKPFLADTPMETLFKHVSEPLPSPSQFVSGLPEGVELALTRALAKKPEDRYANMGAFAEELEMLAFDSSQRTVTTGRNVSEQVPPRRSEPVDRVTDTEATVLQPEARGQTKERTRENKRIISLGKDIQMTFVRVPAGPFNMGTLDSKCDSDEQPQHEVHLDEYWMGKTPVTNIQYSAFIKAMEWSVPSHWKKGRIPEGKEEDPIVFVTWKDAVGFCAWLSKISGEKVCLPTEAEWEKAARGTDGREYPWGNRKPDDDLCNYNHAENGETTPAAFYSPNGDSPYGCADMAGNAWEWTADWYDDKYYNRSPEHNPQGPEKGKERVIRGGSWTDYDYYVRCASRDSDKPSSSFGDIGFRCALDAG